MRKTIKIFFLLSILLFIGVPNIFASLYYYNSSVYRINIDGVNYGTNNSGGNGIQITYDEGGSFPNNTYYPGYWLVVNNSTHQITIYNNGDTGNGINIYEKIGGPYSFVDGYNDSSFWIASQYTNGLNYDTTTETLTFFPSFVGVYNYSWSKWHIPYADLRQAIYSISSTPPPPATPPETCIDGILNQNETSIDFGGVCGTCQDGIQNGNETGIDTGGRCPPGYTNQPKPADGEYYPNIDKSTLAENSGRGNCLYLNPDTTRFEKKFQYCKADDYGATQLIYNTFCQGNGDILGDLKYPYRAYIHGVLNNGKMFIQSLVCSTGNNESLVTNIRLNQLDFEPFVTFKGIDAFQEPYGTGFIRFNIVGIMQNYPSEFTTPLIVGTDDLRSKYKSVLQNESPLAVNETIQANTTNNKHFFYYLDNDYYKCLMDHPITCKLSPPLFIDNNNYINADQYTDLKFYASGIYKSTGALNVTGTLLGDTPPDIVKPFGNSTINVNKDDSIFECTFNANSWYEYIGSPFICGFQVLRNIYNKGNDFVQSVGGILQNIFDFGGDRTPTKAISLNSFFGIQEANAIGFVDSFGEGFIETTSGGDKFLGKYYKFLRYGIYTMILTIILVLFLVYKKK